MFSLQFGDRLDKLMRIMCSEVDGETAEQIKDSLCELEERKDNCSMFSASFMTVPVLALPYICMILIHILFFVVCFQLFGNQYLFIYYVFITMMH